MSDKKLTLQQLSDLLWAADGVNRPDGKRTSPAAMGIYCVDIYVVLPEGVYLYDAAKHELKPVAKGDFRKFAGMQDFVFIAPLNLVYVFTLKKSPKCPCACPGRKTKNLGRRRSGLYGSKRLFVLCVAGSGVSSPGNG